MDIQNMTNHITIPTPSSPGANPPKPPAPLVPPVSTQPGAGNAEGSGEALPDGTLLELESAFEEVRAGEAILDAALAREAEAMKNLKQQDRAELESTKEREYTDPDETAANERLMNRKLSELLHWKYDARLSLSGNYNQIQSMFEALLKDILTDYTGSLQLEFLSQLDAFTLNAIRQLVTEHFQELLNFLGSYGRPGSEEALINGLFENMANRRPLTSMGQGSSGNSAFGGTAYAAQGAQAKGGGQKLTQGIIYQRDAKARINTQYQTVAGKADRSGATAAQVLKQSGYLTGSKAFTLRDVRQAQAFIQYLNQNPSQVSQEKLPYTSEEYLGFSAGVTSLKAQAFIEQSNLGEGTAAALKYAMGTFAQEYFLQNAQALKQTPEFRNPASAPAYQADSFQKIYRYVIDSFTENHDAQGAALSGLKKSLESYYEKQANPAYQNMNRYRSDIGFFSRTPVSDMKNEILNGWKAVCRDWNAFLQYTQLAKEKGVRFDYTLSRDFYAPFFMSQEKSQHNGRFRKKKAVQFMLRLGILVVGIIICLFLLALFS